MRRLAAADAELADGEGDPRLTSQRRWSGEVAGR